MAKNDKDADAARAARNDRAQPQVTQAPTPDVEMDPVEALAREICKTQGRDSEQRVSYAQPTCIGTPEGNAYYTAPADLVPLWNCYAAVARATLKLQAEAKAKA